MKWAWPADKADEAIAALASAAGDRRREAWDVEDIEVVYAQVDELVANAAPALVRLGDGSLLALVRVDTALGPDGLTHAVDAGLVRDAVRAPLEAKIAGEVDAILDLAGAPPARRARARAAIFRERLALERLDAGFILRPAPGAPVGMQVRASGIGLRLGVLAVAYLAAYVLGIVGWWMIANGALDGHLDRGWLFAWALVLLSQLPLRVVAARAQGAIGVDAGALLKRRLLAGVLRLAPDTIRTLGAGQLLGRVFESEAVESLALDAGFLGLTATLELIVAAVVLGFGAAGVAHVVLLVGWLALTFVVAWRYFAGRARWTDQRLEITHDLVERMLGHRTRLAQQPRELWHEGEDDALDHYLDAGERMDTHGARLAALLPRGWIVVALVGLAPWFVTGSATTAALATAVGGTLLAYRAMQKMVVGVASIAGARIAWRTVGPLFHAAAGGSITLPAREAAPRSPSDRPILEGNELVFRYPGRGEPVLRGASLRIHAGDRILVEGRSGGGKSTLGAVLTGMREQDSGLLLLDGLDLKTLGLERWRKRVAAAPQFHQNHVFSAPFAFNLLMGRRWPPRQDDLVLAETICNELELGPLLARMPAGLMQMVGETGWQLSHGEKSRLFVARALLQGADLMVLDESFAALDPKTLEQSLACVTTRANALVVIAHP